MKNTLIKVENASYSYRVNSHGLEDVQAVNDVSISIQKGSFISILGRNGSGKSTFSKLLNALIIPDSGTVIVDGINSENNDLIWDIRSSVGMTFQNPDNQIIGTTVEEDVAFGPENLGVEPNEIRKRVDMSLEAVGMSEYKTHAPHLLSGGQKQRVGIAGILAMKPKCIVTDEATSMLDPSGRKEVMDVLHQLNRDEGITVIHITHHMDESANADRVVIFENGKIIMDGTPKQVFSRVSLIKEMGLDVPQVTELFFLLNKEGLQLPVDVLSVDEAVDIITEYIKK